MDLETAPPFDSHDEFSQRRELALSQLHSIHPRLRHLFENLRDGGPPPDEELIRAYIDGKLEGDELDRIATQIVTWKAWHSAYWQRMAQQLTPNSESDESEFNDERDEKRMR